MKSLLGRWLGLLTREPPEPVYDPSVRVGPDRSLQIIWLIAALLWVGLVVSNFVHHAVTI